MTRMFEHRGRHTELKMPARRELISIAQLLECLFAGGGGVVRGGKFSRADIGGELVEASGPGLKHLLSLREIEWGFFLECDMEAVPGKPHSERVPLARTKPFSSFEVEVDCELPLVIGL